MRSVDRIYVVDDRETSRCQLRRWRRRRSQNHRACQRFVGVRYSSRVEVFEAGSSSGTDCEISDRGGRTAAVQPRKAERIGTRRRYAGRLGVQCAAAAGVAVEFGDQPVGTVLQNEVNDDAAEWRGGLERRNSSTVNSYVVAAFADRRIGNRRGTQIIEVQRAAGYAAAAIGREVPTIA